jgi:hypothetical protein
MEEIIQLRLNHWINDIDGRRDFSHALNMKIHMEKRKREKTDEPWGRLTEHEQKEIISGLKSSVINEKREELRSSERETASITKDLFWIFDKYCREKNYQSTTTFGKWLIDHTIVRKNIVVLLLFFFFY